MQVSSQDAALKQLANKLASMGMAGGELRLPADPNKRIRAPYEVFDAMKVLASTKVSFNLIPDEDAEPGRAHVLRSLEWTKDLLTNLRALQARVSGHPPFSLPQGFAAAVLAAIARISEVAAMLSLTAGTSDYLDLGFSAVERPDIEPDTDDAATLFDAEPDRAG